MSSEESCVGRFVVGSEEDRGDGEARLPDLSGDRKVRLRAHLPSDPEFADQHQEGVAGIQCVLYALSPPGARWERVRFASHHTRQPAVARAAESIWARGRSGPR